jgi:DNA polymerase elongation subunit (family B)
MNEEIGTDITIDWENGDTDILSAAEVYRLIFESNQPWVMSANGTIFSYETEGIIPGLLKRWYAERKDMQKKLKEAINAGNKIEEEYWDKRQLVKKINLNSLYGAILNPGCRFFDKRIGQSTTLTGRQIAKHMAAKVNEIITGEYNHTGKSIIYGDTDSCYFSAYPTLKREIDNGSLPWSKETVVQLYDQISDQVNGTFQQFMLDAFHCPKSRGEVIKAGREIVGSKSLFITKKRYAVLVYDKEGKRKDTLGKNGEIKAMGLDLKRSDTPEFIQDFLSQVLEMVLGGDTEQHVLDYISKFRISFKARPGWEKGSPKRANSITSYLEKEAKQGKVNMPGHVRASLNWNTLKRMYDDKYSMSITDGAKVIVCKLKQNPLGFTSVAYPVDELRLPQWFKNLPFDHNGMEDTIIDNKLDNLIGILNWKLADTSDRNTFNSLFEFE